MRRPIAISLSPNTQKEDVVLSLKLFFSPWEFFRNGYVLELQEWFCSHFHVDYAVTFDSGRSALLRLLQVAGVGSKDEVILQAFTCVAVPNAIIACDARPVYVDVDESLTIDPADLEKKITKNTKVVIVQHTFGNPASMDKISQITKKNNILLIEDCAHTIGGEYKNKKLGTIGEASFFSFGRDKAFSCVSGGVVIAKNKSLGEKLVDPKQKLTNPNPLWTWQQLFHPIAFAIILPLYDFFNLGKFLLIIFQKLHLLSLPVSKVEKNGVMTKITKKMSNSLAALAILQLKKLTEYNQRRIDTSEYYRNKINIPDYKLDKREKIPYLRFPILIKKRDEIFRMARKAKLYLGKWYENVIDPVGVNCNKVLYKRGSCPKAEKYASLIINLPTYPTMNEEEKEEIVTFINNYVSH